MGLGLGDDRFDVGGDLCTRGRDDQVASGTVGQEHGGQMSGHDDEVGADAGALGEPDVGVGGRDEERGCGHGNPFGAWIPTVRGYESQRSAQAGISLE
ncbi:hypothetical protein [Streptomyces sp. Agncl-13]|uniref:hypothetical protein n=1 Tax=Streptomyces sp. Agncl-13 TaxID=3400628 RepID=UPI003A844986